MDDPIAHAAEKHQTTNIHKRVVPCPLGCGMVLTPMHYQPTLPQSVIDRHTRSDKCLARMVLVEKAKVECTDYLEQKAFEYALLNGVPGPVPWPSKLDREKREREAERDAQAALENPSEAAAAAEGDGAVPS